MKNKIFDFIYYDKNTLLVQLVCLAIFMISVFTINDFSISNNQQTESYVEYENAKVIEILSDNTYQDEMADGGWRGEQMLLAEVLTGRYKGETLLAYNYVGPIYSVPVKKGEGITLIISTYKDGSHQASVYEVNRLSGIIVLLLLFVIAAITVGGKSGAKSLLGLCFMVASLFLILLPALMKGAPTILMTFSVCVLVTAFSFALMSGVNQKSICAFIGTILGTAMALLFAYMSQKILRLDGLRLSDVEALLQLRNAGSRIGLRGLLSAGIIISSLGAIMDVTMGLSSSISELHQINSELDSKQLFLSGMNIGKDMVGTMTNTLILAFLGSGFTLILYLYSLNLGVYQLLSSAYLSIEIISGLSSSIGAILSVPLTAFICAKVFVKH